MSLVPAAGSAGAFDEDGRAVAGRCGAYAAVAAGNLYAYRSARDLADDLQVALESRGVIDQAEGVLVERYRLTPDQASQLLARASNDADRKLRDVADHLVHTGEFPLRRSSRQGGGGGSRPPGVSPRPRRPRR